MDDEFNWIGTDNDQVLGDKIFSPFPGAHFGWGHPWSYDWKGDDHLPSAPSSGPLFEGSGTGAVFLNHPDWPRDLQGVFLINDWLNRETLVFRPEWQGASLRSKDLKLEVLAHADGGRTMDRSAGRSFDPVDMELGPDGALYVSSWGREYGAVYEKGEWKNEGRIYRIAPRSSATSWQEAQENFLTGLTGKSEQIRTQDLVAALGSPFHPWRVEAQNELVRRGREVSGALKEALARLDLKNDQRSVTWILWTLGRIDVKDREADRYFLRAVNRQQAPLNYRVQAVRILADRIQRRGDLKAPEFAAQHGNASKAKTCLDTGVQRHK
jgi:hypothetical protein